VGGGSRLDEIGEVPGIIPDARGFESLLISNTGENRIIIDDPKKGAKR
jgi:hypothetical protein